MTALLLSGKDASAAVLASLKKDVETYDPKSVIIQVGEDPASTSYIKQKTKASESIGMRYEHVHLDEKTSLEELFKKIEELNTDDDVTGFMVQVPLPDHLQPYVPEITRRIDPRKDIDGFTAYNIGKMFLSTEFEHLPPATPGGIILLLEHYDLADVTGKEVVVVGHSATVGRPISTMLLNRDATVTTCHIHTKDLSEHTKKADILIVAAGVPGLVSADMVKEGAIVIDVGITRTDDGLKGDVEFDAVKEKVSAITPVPGGVGPMTVASLMKNCVTAAKRQAEES